MLCHAISIWFRHATFRTLIKTRGNPQQIPNKLSHSIQILLSIPNRSQLHSARGHFKVAISTANRGQKPKAEVEIQALPRCKSEENARHFFRQFAHTGTHTHTANGTERKRKCAFKNFNLHAQFRVWAVCQKWRAHVGQLATVAAPHPTQWTTQKTAQSTACPNVVRLGISRVYLQRLRNATGCR